jgi:hypothetical protein
MVSLTFSLKTDLDFGENVRCNRHGGFVVIQSVDATPGQEDVSEKSITQNRSIVLGEEKERLKNDYRFRKIPASAASSCICQTVNHPITAITFSFLNITSILPSPKSTAPHLTSMYRSMLLPSGM